MIPKFIELTSYENGVADQYVNVNNIHSIRKGQDGFGGSFIVFNNGLTPFRDKRTPIELYNLINSTEALPTKEVLTFPRKMLVHNGGENQSKDEYIVIADLGEGFVFRYVCVAWGTEDFFEDGSGCFNTSMYKFAEDIGEL